MDMSKLDEAFSNETASMMKGGLESGLKDSSLKTNGTEYETLDGNKMNSFEGMGGNKEDMKQALFGGGL